jgi:hypothetical protein
MSPRVLPPFLEAEHQVLGALLSGYANLEDVGDILSPDFFADPVNGFIFRQIAERVDVGLSTKELMVEAAGDRLPAEFDRHLEEVGGKRYLYQLAVIGRTVEPWDAARQIRGAWFARRVIIIGEQIIEAAQNAIADALDLSNDSQALANMFARAIDGCRNQLPTEAEFAAVLGFGLPDRFGKPIVRAVALSESEIETLYNDHVYAAKRFRPRKGKQQAPDFSQAYDWHSARVPFFQEMLPVDEPDEEDIDQVANELRDPADLREGEIVEGNVVDMREPSA